LLDAAERLTGWAYRLLGCRAQALDGRLHRARGHVGQVVSASRILDEASVDSGGVGTGFEDRSRPLQEVYSLRCAPQFLGACRDQLAHARRLIELEINGVNDNPLIFAASLDGPAAAVHGGNFQGQQIAFAADAINAAVTQVAVLVERQIDVVLSPAHNGGAPLLLAWTPGPCSGMAGAQITATALVADMRHHGMPAATSSIPTNGGNQDVVSMGTNAARYAYDQAPRCAAVLAVMGLSLARLRDLRDRGRTPGQPGSWPAWMPACRSFTGDVPLHNDIAHLADALLAVLPKGRAVSHAGKKSRAATE
jgi:histidine ammonia-lyase/tyrosine ammonia-lyase